MSGYSNAASPLHPDLSGTAVPDAASNSILPSKPPLPQPPLSISHLMLWTLGSALILSASRSLFRQEFATDALEHLDVFRSLGVSILYGIKLAALFVFLSRAVRRDAPLPHEPGHWLLLKGGVDAVVGFLLFAILLWNRDGERNVSLRDVALYYSIVYSLHACLWLAAIVGLACCRAVLWQILFAYLLVTCGISAAVGAGMLWESYGDPRMSFGSGVEWFSWWNQIQPWAEYVPACAGICGLVLWGYFRGERRDWLHFVGAGTEAAMTMLFVVLQIAQSILIN